MKHTLLRKIIYATIAIALCIISVFVFKLGITQIKDTRYISRLQIAPIAITVQGDYLISGQIYGVTHLLLTPFSEQQALIFDFKIEERYINSDGDTKWRTTHHRTEAVDFYIEDSSAKTRVSLNNYDLANIPIQFPHQNTTSTEGYRYTEKWITSHDFLTMFGFKPNANLNVFTISPNANKPYFINGNGKDAQLQTMGLKGLFSIWLALSFTTIALVLIFSALSKHRIIGFLTVLSVVQITLLLIAGSSLIKRDITQTANYLKEQQLNIRLLENKDTQQKFIEQYYQQIYSNAHYQLHHFPDNIIAFFSSIVLPEADLDILPNNIKKVELQHGSIIWILIVSLCLLILFLWIGLKYTISKRMIENIPTSKIKGVMIGLSEIKGKMIQYQDQILTSPLTSTTCCWYDYKVEELKQSGKDKSWKTIEKRSEWKLLKCKDDSDGEMIINPSNADISSQYESSERIGNFRYSETCLPFNQLIYLFGNVSVGHATGNVMMKTQTDQKLIISTFNENSIMLKKGMVAMSMMGAVFSLSILFGLLTMARIGSFEPSNYVLLALCVPVFLMAVVGVLHYNDILFLQNRADRNFANIQVTLKKRYDLLTNLQKVVKGYLQHEHKLLQALSVLRSNFNKALNYDQATPDRVKKIMQQELHFQQSFNMIAEDYPDLKSDELIQDFMNRQTKMENEISLIREGYNDAVNRYNERIQSFPDKLLANHFGFAKKRYA
ncbi:LemA family protein [Marinicellulosiphila megalodicopiae]|uniref:LemA family protein n=1 Tax=Marinicellulosiphila megalodicopiae TaxID=2724896 RepID=UPI003BB182B4